MRKNSRMEEMIKRCDPNPALLASGLAAILEKGLAYENGCLLLKSQMSLMQSEIRTEFQDDTGYECFVNHLHLEDILASSDGCFLLKQALAFAEALTNLKSDAAVSEPVEYIISGTEHEVNVRFHLIRPNEVWLAENLEGYEEAVAAIQLPNEHHIER